MHTKETAPRDAAALAPRCVICDTALTGPLGGFFRLAGIRRSSHNPNVCSRCNTHVQEGVLSEVTVLFSDLRSFTEMTQRLGAEQTFQVVNAFADVAGKALIRHDAYVDKYIGDAVMAFFNVPIRRSDHSARALAAALEILASLPALEQEFGVQLSAGVGIARGWVRVGRVGSLDREDYTIIGDVANLAARLVGLARPGEILMDEATRNDLGDHLPETPAESFQAKGFSEPVVAYSIGAATGPRPVLKSAEPRTGMAVRIGSIVFAVLGAPCAAAVMLSPVALWLGFGTLFAAASPIWAYDQSPLRTLLVVLASLGAIANLYTVWHARRLTAQAPLTDRLAGQSRNARRRTRAVVGFSVLTLAVVSFESVAHVLHWAR